MGGVASASARRPSKKALIAQCIDYRHFPRIQLSIVLENISMNARRQTWLQQDAPHVHNKEIITDVLRVTRPSRWIRWNNFAHWSTYSPDFNSTLDLNLRGYGFYFHPTQYIFGFE